MKPTYIKILKGQTVAARLPYKKFAVTIDGDLLCLDGNSIRETVAAGAWVTLEKTKAVSRAVLSFNKPLKLSPELQLIVKGDNLARTEVVKRLWSFIRKHELQDKTNRRMIHMGKHPLTKQAFKVEQVNMFEMTKLLAKHIK